MTDVVAAILGDEAILAIDRRLLIVRMILNFIQILTIPSLTGGNNHL